jgi:hypothetical protein
MSNKEHQILGTKLSKADFANIESSFRNKFFISGKNLNWKGSKRPSWCEIIDGSIIEELNGEVKNTIPLFDEYYVYFEFAKEIYLCSYNDIVDYFENLPKWIEKDFYIFTEKMNWCLVNTHDSENFLIKPV